MQCGSMFTSSDTKADRCLFFFILTQRKSAALVLEKQLGSPVQTLVTDGCPEG